MTQAESPALSFTAFIISLAHTAAVHFGDVPDPGTGQPGEVNLDGARQMIEILGLLEARTKGNLSAEERQVLDTLLYELRLRYVKAAEAAPRPVKP